jgi:5'-3' exoribonuclease 1
MGVPKFFRWISERYPRINQPLHDDNVMVPDIDHLYFDLNGIIHMCSHNNNDTLSMRMQDEEIFKNIEGYMDMIISQIIKPKASIFIAIDGVAPRAKLNQQRGRRFRSARERYSTVTSSLTLHMYCSPVPSNRCTCCGVFQDAEYERRRTGKHGC